MISGIITLAYDIASFGINLLPTSTGFPTEVHSAFSTLGGYLGIMDVFIPLSLLLFCLTTVFSVEIAVFAFKTGKWILSHIPVFGGKGNVA